jgi:hypothetical protein
MCVSEDSAESDVEATSSSRSRNHCRGGGGLDMFGVMFLQFVVCVDKFRVLYVCVSLLLWYILGWSWYASLLSGAAVRLPNPHMFVIVAVCVRVAALFCKVLLPSPFQGARCAPRTPCPSCVCAVGLVFIMSRGKCVKGGVCFGSHRSTCCVCVSLSAARVATRVPGTVLWSLFFCVCCASVLLLPLLAASPSMRSSLSGGVWRSPNPHRSVFGCWRAPGLAGPVFADSLLEL